MSRHRFLRYAWTSPYTGSRLSLGYKIAGGQQVYNGKVKSLSHWQRLERDVDEAPEVMILGNFTVERHSILQRCRQLGIDTVYGEDGWFPHSHTCHADPLGFCWESSLTRMVFERLTDLQRRQALACRKSWIKSHKQKLLPDEAKKGPYVLWPLQLIKDKVNTFGLAAPRWSIFVEHFRNCLPPEINLLLKNHPIDKESKKPRLQRMVRKLSNVDFVPPHCSLQALIANSVGVAGMNSSVLFESRLIYQKPTWCYADSWFSNHWEVFYKADHRFRGRELQNCQALQDSNLVKTGRDEDYTLWFLAQLLARQYMVREVKDDKEGFGRWFDRRTFNSWCSHGESIFDGTDLEVVSAKMV